MIRVLAAVLAVTLVYFVPFSVTVEFGRSITSSFVVGAVMATSFGATLFSVLSVASEIVTLAVVSGIEIEIVVSLFWSNIFGIVMVASPFGASVTITSVAPFSIASST